MWVTAHVHSACGVHLLQWSGAATKQRASEWYLDLVLLELGRLRMLQRHRQRRNLVVVRPALQSNRDDR